MTTDDAGPSTTLDRLRPPWGRRLPVRLLVSGLALLLAVRLVPLPRAFPGGAVVLSSNDPYWYRYWVDRLVTGSYVPWAFPEPVATGEPLLFTVLWLGTVLLGGSQWASGVVLAVYPVLSALVTGVLVYATATRLTDDVRVGIAALLFLAVTPAHAFRSGLGFGDHHAFDYAWLALTLFGLVSLTARTSRSSEIRRWRMAGVVAVGIAGQTLAWEAGPLLVFPVGITVAVSALLVVRSRSSDASGFGPLVAGVAGGALLTVAAHVGLGWQSTPVVSSVVLLAAGSLVVLGLTVVVRRLDRSWPTMLALEAGVLFVVVLVGLVSSFDTWLFPEFAARVRSGISFFGDPSTLLVPGDESGETSSLVDDWGPVLGPLVVLGFAPFLAVPVVPWALRAAWRRLEPAWLVVGIYTLYFAALALLQRRFAGEFAPVLAVCAGFGFVALLAWLELVRPPRPLRATADPPDEVHETDAPGRDEGNRLPEVKFEAGLDRTRRTLLGGLSLVTFGTSGMYAGLIDDRVTHRRGAVRAAQSMREYSDRHELAYPENYVLSEVGDNRMYNYFVSGDSQSFTFATHNYSEFLFGSDGEAWYRELDDRVGFVVTRDSPQLPRGEIHPSRLYARLHFQYGSATATAPGVGHYRGLFASDEGRYKAFALVPGAVVRGTTDGSPTRLSTSVPLAGTGADDFEYVRRIDPGEDGTFVVTVAHPGTYRLGERQFCVSEHAVVEGATISLDGSNRCRG